MLQNAELSVKADSENYLGGSSETMYYIGLDVHKKTNLVGSSCERSPAARRAAPETERSLATRR